MKSILLIDDDKTFCLFVSKMFKDSMYIKLDYYLNGENGFEAFMDAFEKDSPYDGILLDIILPDYNGLKILQGIREFEKTNDLPETCLAVVTSRKDVSIGIMAKEYGAENFLYKDGNIEQQVRDFIENYCRE